MKRPSTLAPLAAPRGASVARRGPAPLNCAARRGLTGLRLTP